jgi:hypothetical protein
MIEKFKSGMELGRKHHTKIATMSDRWKNRKVPACIRASNLLVPYYVVEENGEYCLYVIQFPILASDKVHFLKFARSGINEEEESPQILIGKK